MRPATWECDGKKITGHYEWHWSSELFHIILDSTDPITDRQREIVIGGDTPEWGKWKLVEEPKT